MTTTKIFIRRETEGISPVAEETSDQRRARLIINGGNMPLPPEKKPTGCEKNLDIKETSPLGRNPNYGA